MTIAGIINRLFERFGAGRVLIVNVESQVVVCTVGGREYAIFVGDLSDGPNVLEYIEGDIVDETPGSRWIEGILLGKRRNDAGEMVDA